MRRASLVLASALLIAPAAAKPASGQPAVPATDTRPAPPGSFELTVDSIMRGTDLVGWTPSALRWSADSQKLYFDWRKPGEKAPSTYVVPRSGGEPRKLSDEEARSVPSATGLWDKAHRRTLFVDDGDIVMVDSAVGSRRQITRTTGAESNPRWARNDTHVTYVRDGNLFIVPVNGAGDALISQLTDVGPKKAEPKLTESQQFLRDEEEKLIDYIREQKAQKKSDEDKIRKNKLPSFELQERQSAVDLMLSPDETHVFILVSERAATARSAVVPNYVTETGYIQDITGRSNVGDTQDRRLLAILDLKTGTTIWADGSFAPPVADGEKPAENAGRKSDRDVRWSMPAVSADGKHIVASARSADNKDRWFVTLDAGSGKTAIIDTLHDDAWIRETTAAGGGVEFLRDDPRVWFLSERDGWLHLYTLDVSSEGAKAKQITSGRWEVAAAELSQDGRHFYLTTNEVHPGERHLYSVPIDGGRRTQITSMTGSNEAEVSPDDSTLGLVYSYSNKPPEVFLAPSRPGAAATQITTTPTTEWRSFNWIDPRVITFRARDGVDVYARLFTPEIIGAARDSSHPGVVFVHGAGYLQNAHKYWSTSYFREYMFHNLLASRGYVVLDVDYRASSGYGRDWRTAIYRHMGGKDLDDVVDAAKYLAEKEQVDAKRIGVYGGSYGGFITLMAMFTTPDVFAAGAALRPVTDWAHYNHGYTSNILNLPQKDMDAYRQSSPIYFAAGLKGALLICHGMVDTNVFFQDSVRLVQRLIELRKDNWEIAPYPVENHAFTEAASWTDEYKRILRLFEDNLRLKRLASGEGHSN
jgi:dipeptidyl aminopeptidase/acylaminoacyl peptidase